MPVDQRKQRADYSTILQNLAAHKLSFETFCNYDLTKLDLKARFTQLVDYRDAAERNSADTIIRQLVQSGQISGDSLRGDATFMYHLNTAKAGFEQFRREAVEKLNKNIRLNECDIAGDLLVDFDKSLDPIRLNADNKDVPEIVFLRREKQRLESQTIDDVLGAFSLSDITAETADADTREFLEKFNRLKQVVTASRQDCIRKLDEKLQAIEVSRATRESQANVATEAIRGSTASEQARRWFEHRYTETGELVRKQDETRQNKAQAALSNLQLAFKNHRPPSTFENPRVELPKQGAAEDSAESAAGHAFMEGKATMAEEKELHELGAKPYSPFPGLRR